MSNFVSLKEAFKFGANEGWSIVRDHMLGQSKTCEYLSQAPYGALCCD